jgi:hypothetical protein
VNKHGQAQRIVNIKEDRGKKYVFVQWKHPDTKASWIPEEDVDKDLVEEFYRKDTLVSGRPKRIGVKSKYMK